MPAPTPYKLTHEDTIDLDEAQIRQLALDAVAAWNCHDVRAFTRVYADDADLTNVIGTTVRGRKAIHDHHAEIFETIFRKSHLEPGEIRVRFLSPEIAVVDIRWEMTGALEWDGKEILIRKGLLSWIVTRQRGAWLVKVMHNQEFTPLRY
ncbi:MAG: SgcJ/EcaC family oxidoreductase [Acidobacteriia bacterium]|nr:SgcJ/EcaC family oxidoreductase [Terriglobia bacterium]